MKVDFLSPMIYVLNNVFLESVMPEILWRHQPQNLWKLLCPTQNLKRKYIKRKRLTKIQLY